jgi:hypothetical protein
MEVLVWQYPHILKPIDLPEDYAAIIPSGIITSPTKAPITTKLSVGFELHLPYITETSLLVAAGPDIAVNLIFGLLFIKATGMIANFIDIVCEAKHLICSLFPIDFCCATKSISVCGDWDAASHSIEFQEVFKVLGFIKVYLAHLLGNLPLGPLAPPSTPTAILDVHSKHVTFIFRHQWEPPSKSVDDTNDYHHQVLGDLG